MSFTTTLLSNDGRERPADRDLGTQPVVRGANGGGFHLGTLPPGAGSPVQPALHWAEAPGRLTAGRSPRYL
jgi:hypothetical protein